MSHIEICPSAGFCSFPGTHTLSLAEMLRLACGHSYSSSVVTTALISFSLQVILDPCAAIGNLHQEMKSRRWTLQNLVSLKGRPLSMVNESKLNHKGPLHSGQIFRLAVKSYLRLTGCDGRKWYVVTIVETAALLLQSCLHDAQVVVNCRKPAPRNIKLLVGSEGSDFLYNRNKHIKYISSWHVQQSHFANMGSWKAGRHISNLLWLESSISKTIHSLAVVTWNHRRSEYSSTSPRDHNSVTKPSASLHETCFFCSCNERMGMMQP